ncbi:MAG: EexN family lipoprotein [Pseudomonadota bacterium]
MKLRRLQLVAAALVLTACAEEPPPRSVQQFLDNEILLDAAMARCSRNRVETRYEAECVNAREAVKIIEAQLDAERRKEFEARSEEKRRALRETQAAAAVARRRAAEAARQREEAEYLAQFGALPEGGVPVSTENGGPAVNAPVAVVPAAPVTQPEAAPTENPFDDVASDVPTSQPTGNLPAAVVEETEPEPDEDPASDLQSIRDELKRRQDPPQ